MGQYSAVAGASYCTDCAVGTYTPVVGATSCIMCPAGTFGAQSGTSMCTECPVGTYTDIVGATACMACASGQSTMYTGSVMCEPNADPVDVSVGCLDYFDGCNNCGRESPTDDWGWCTEMACFVAGTPSCNRYAHGFDPADGH